MAPLRETSSNHLDDFIWQKRINGASPRYAVINVAVSKLNISYSGLAQFWLSFGSVLGQTGGGQRSAEALTLDQL